GGSCHGVRRLRTVVRRLERKPQHRVRPVRRRSRSGSGGCLANGSLLRLLRHHSSGGKKTVKRVVRCWSGGKDSSLALAALRADPEYEVVALLTSITREYDR